VRGALHLRQRSAEADVLGEDRPHLLAVGRLPGDPFVLAQLAARRLGVAILPESAAGIEPSLRMLAIRRPSLRSRIELAWRADGAQSAVAPAARVLIAAARAFFSDAPGRPGPSA
jgi:DNA-binding transcriptional LysR family regulator